MSLKGNLNLGKTLISLKAMLRTIKHEKQGVYVKLSHIESDSTERQWQENIEEQPRELKELSSRFAATFPDNIKVTCNCTARRVFTCKCSAI